MTRFTFAGYDPYMSGKTSYIQYQWWLVFSPWKYGQEESENHAGWHIGLSILSILQAACLAFYVYLHGQELTLQIYYCMGGLHRYYMVCIRSSATSRWSSCASCGSFARYSSSTVAKRQNRPTDSTWALNEAKGRLVYRSTASPMADDARPWQLRNRLT
jgi:hypothetical protein